MYVQATTSGATATGYTLDEGGLGQKIICVEQ